MEHYRRLAEEGRLGPMLERAAEAAAARRKTQAAKNATHTFRLRGSDCEVAEVVVADIIAENDHLVVYEEVDAESPVPQENADSIIDFYSEHGADVIEDYFGGVSDVNGDDKIVVHSTAATPGRLPSRATTTSTRCPRQSWQRPQPTGASSVAVVYGCTTSKPWARGTAPFSASIPARPPPPAAAA